MGAWMQPRNDFTGALMWSSEAVLTSIQFASVTKTMQFTIVEKKYTFISPSENSCTDVNNLSIS